MRVQSSRNRWFGFGAVVGPVVLTLARAYGNPDFCSMTARMYHFARSVSFVMVAGSRAWVGNTALHSEIVRRMSCAFASAGDATVLRE
jgi:hypothetical protein